MKSGLAQKIKRIVLGFWEGVTAVKKVAKPWPFILHSINIWVMYFLMNWFCMWAFEPTAHLGLMAALMVFVFGAFGIVIPSPGGMGSYHFLVMAALALYGIAGTDAFSFANILFFFVNLFGNVLIGIIALIALPIINKNYQPDWAG